MGRIYSFCNGCALICCFLKMSFLVSCWSWSCAEILARGPNIYWYLSHISSEKCDKNWQEQDLKKCTSFADFDYHWVCMRNKDLFPSFPKFLHKKKSQKFSSVYVRDPMVEFLCVLQLAFLSFFTSEFGALGVIFTFENHRWMCDKKNCSLWPTVKAELS